VREEIVEVLTEFQSYRAGGLPDDVEKEIHGVAANPEVSKQVIAKIRSEVPVAHKSYLRIWRSSLICFFLPIFAVWLSPLFPRPIHTLLTSDSLNGVDTWGIPSVCVFLWLVAAGAFLALWFTWRQDHHDAYIADYLIRALEIGLIYLAAPTSDQARDRLATSIQRAAIRYSAAYRRSESTAFFTAQVRAQAKNCRNDIISIVPTLVTANRDEIDMINADLARLLIRSQTGYWHQTHDIARHGTPLRRWNSIRISIASFIGDRSIQVAMLAVFAAIVAAVIGTLIPHLRG